MSDLKELYARLETLERKNGQLEKELAETVQLVKSRVPAPFSRTNVQFGNDCNIAPATIFIGDKDAPISIGSRVRIRRGAELIGDIHIGDACSINRDVYIRSKTRIGPRVNIGPFVRFVTDHHELRDHIRRTGDHSYKGSSQSRV